MDIMGPCGSYVALPAKKEVRTGPKLRQATQIPTECTAPAHTLQHAEHIVQPDLASTTGRIAHASNQQTLLAPGKCIGPIYAVSAQGGAISLADAHPPWIVQHSTCEHEQSLATDSSRNRRQVFQGKGLHWC